MTTDELATSYEHCRRLQRTNGRTFYLATLLLPRWKRRHVHALYGFTRYTDDIVDVVEGTTAIDRLLRLTEWTARFAEAMDGGPTADPILPAIRHTITVFDLDVGDFAAFLRSMAMDLAFTEYATYDDLLAYMEGSAAAIGTMMLPILGSRDPMAAREPARQLGFAFQLTNFIRDVGEDLARGRVYLPAKDLAEYGVTTADLEAGVVTAPIRRLIACEVERARWHYRMAAPGIPLLDPSSQPCIRAAYHMYRGILNEVIANDYNVFTRRAVVPNRRRLAITAASLMTPPGRRVRAG